MEGLASKRTTIGIRHAKLLCRRSLFDNLKDFLTIGCCEFGPAAISGTLPSLLIQVAVVVDSQVYLNGSESVSTDRSQATTPALHAISSSGAALHLSLSFRTF